MVVGLWVWHENCGGSHGIKVYEKERLRLKKQREREDYCGGRWGQWGLYKEICLHFTQKMKVKL